MGAHQFPLTLLRARAVPRVRIARSAFGLPLAGIVGVSFVWRSIAALGHVSPRYFPDEYIYASLARSIAQGRGLSIRGEAAHFPALLEPLLSAPFWLSNDAAVAYRLTLIWHALAMSLAAVPVALLCRRLQLPNRVALAAGAFSVALPALTWGSYLTADAIAYPLALGAICAIVETLRAPTWRKQLLALTLCGAATSARVQYVVLFAVFAVASTVIAQGRLRELVKSYRFSLVVLAIPAALVVARGPGKILGYYSAVTSLGVHPVAIAHWIGVDLALLALATGVVLVPGAAVGLLGALARPKSRDEAAFGLVTGLFAAALFFEAGLYASNGSARFQERYLIALSPLLAPAFALGMKRTGRWRLAGLGVAAGLLIFCARVPLSGYTRGNGPQDSPFLGAVSRLQAWTSAPSGALIAALLATVLAVVGALVLFRPRGSTIGLAVACVTAIGMSLASIAFDHDVSNRARNTYAPGDKQWVDHANVGAADILLLPYTPRSITPVHLFWNTSLHDVLRLPLAEEPDAFRQYAVRVARDGTLLKDGRPNRRPLLVEEYLGKVELQRATRVRTTLMSTLWRPEGVARLSWLERGRYFDGWLASKSSLTIWPDSSGRVRGTVRLRLYLPPLTETASLRLSAPGLKRMLSVHTGSHSTVNIPVDVAGPWTLRLRSTVLRFLPDGRDVSVRSLPPVFARASTLKPASTLADRG
jgi:hypothetical protein